MKTRKRRRTRGDKRANKSKCGTFWLTNQWSTDEKPPEAMASHQQNTATCKVVLSVGCVLHSHYTRLPVRRQWLDHWFLRILVTSSTQRFLFFAIGIPSQETTYYQLPSLQLDDAHMFVSTWFFFRHIRRTFEENLSSEQNMFQCTNKTEKLKAVSDKGLATAQFEKHFESNSNPMAKVPLALRHLTMSGCPIESTTPNGMNRSCYANLALLHVFLGIVRLTIEFRDITIWRTLEATWRVETCFCIEILFIWFALICWPHAI